MRARFSLTVQGNKKGLYFPLVAKSICCPGVDSGVPWSLNYYKHIRCFENRHLTVHLIISGGSCKSNLIQGIATLIVLFLFRCCLDSSSTPHDPADMSFRMSLVIFNFPSFFFLVKPVNRSLFD